MVSRKKRRIARAIYHQSINKEIKEVDVESIYFACQEWWLPYLKYWRQNNGSVTRYINCPWTLFVEDYVRLRDEIWDNFEDHVCIKWERDMFLTADKRTHKKIDGLRSEKRFSAKGVAKRLIILVDSINKYGYCGGEYNNEGSLINVVDGYVSPYDGSKGYKLLKGNHRIAVCAGLGIKKIKVKCWEYY